MPWGNLQTIEIFYMNFFDDSTNFKNLCCCGSISPKTVSIFRKTFLNLRFSAIEKKSIIEVRVMPL